MAAVLEQMKRLQTRLVEVFMAKRLPEDSLSFFQNKSTKFEKIVGGRSRRNSRAEERSVKSRQKGENYNSFSLDKNQFPLVHSRVFRRIMHYSYVGLSIYYAFTCAAEREGEKGER